MCVCGGGGGQQPLLITVPQKLCKRLGRVGVLRGRGRVRRGANSHPGQGLNGDLVLAPTEVEDVGGSVPCPRALSATWEPLQGHRDRDHRLCKRAHFWSGCWLNDEAMVSPSHSPFFTASELQKRKPFTLRPKLFVTMQKTCHQQPFVWA